MTESLFAPPPPPRPAGLPGVDLSSLQSPDRCDYAKIAQAAKWAVVRIAEGKDPDTAHRRHRACLQGHGVAVGAYAFARPRHPAGDMANVAIEQLGADAWDLPIALDLESDDPADVLTPEALEEWCLEWLGDVEHATGRKPWIYTGPSFVATRLPAHHSLWPYPLWVAHYGVSKPALPRGWSSATAWQWSGTAAVAGYPGPADASVLLVPLDSVTVPPPRDTAPTLDPVDWRDR